MSLLQSIQTECVASNADVARLLRLCLQLAARLRHAPLKDWVLRELNGYPDGVDLPDYRILHTGSKGFFADRFTQATLEIPMSVLEEPLKSRFSEARLDQPIKQYEDLLQGAGELVLPWPQELVFHTGPKISEIECIKIWQVLSRSALAGVIDTVKTRVLSMALEIEAENPEAGEIQGSALPIPEATVAQIFNTNIYGGQVQNLAAGSPGAVMNATSSISAGDMQALQSFLHSHGITPIQTNELAIAIREDIDAGARGIGERVGKWLSGLPEKMRRGAGEVASQTIVGLATQAILAYLGFGGG